MPFYHIGLEFPVVIMAGLNKQINKTDARTTPEQKYEELTSEEVVATEKEAVTEEPETAARRSNRLNVKCVLQNPELPTGCEITALTIVLNYLGYDVDKLTMADKYLDKGPVGKLYSCLFTFFFSHICTVS